MLSHWCQDNLAHDDVLIAPVLLDEVMRDFPDPLPYDENFVTAVGGVGYITSMCESCCLPWHM